MVRSSGNSPNTKGGTVLMDMNGDDARIHISLAEVVEKGLPLAGSNTTFYGNRLAEDFESPNSKMNCAEQGQTISIPY